MIPESIARKVLTVGAQHQNHRGGIGGVLAVYANHIRPFNYIATFRPYKHKVKYLPYFALKYVWFVGTLLFDRNIEIVHIHGSADGSFVRKYLLFLTAKKIFRRKIIYHIHAGRYIRFYQNSHPIVKACIRQFVEGSDLVICLSEEWRRQFTQTFPSVNVRVLGNVVEPFVVNQTATIKPEGQPLNVLFLGLIGDNKGIFDILTMMGTHRVELNGKLKLTIGGNGETDRLKQAIKHHHLESMVNFVGWVTGEQKQRLLQESDVYLLPSYSEGLPVSILEAMSAGLAILSTPVGGIPEIIVDGLNGYLVKPGDQETFYQRIMTFITNPELVRSMGRQSRLLVRAYEPAQVFATLSDFYTELLSPIQEQSIFSNV